MPFLNISPNFWQIFPCKELAEVYFYLRSVRGTEFGFFKQNIGCVMDKQENPWELAGCIWRNLFTRISKNLEKLLGKVRDGIFIYKSCSTWPLSCRFQKWKLTKEFGAKLLLVLSQVFLEWGGDMLSLLFTTHAFFCGRSLRAESRPYKCHEGIYISCQPLMPNYLTTFPNREHSECRFLWARLYPCLQFDMEWIL